MSNDTVVELTNNPTGTLFPTYRRVNIKEQTRLSSSFLKIFTALVVLDAVLANSPPNPFAFIQKACYYSLTTSPVVTPSSLYVQGWEAYLTTVNSLVNGTVGDITQFGDTYVPAQTIWTQSACQINFLLQSNCSQSQATTFVTNFGNMVKDILIAMCPTSKGSFTVFLAVLAGLAGLCVLSLAAGCAKESILACAAKFRRRGYDEVKGQSDVNPNSAVVVDITPKAIEASL